MHKPKYITKISNITQIDKNDQKRLENVTDKFMFRTNDYYQSLIDWDDPNDPIRRIVIPTQAELVNWGKLDASDEKSYTKVPGLEHKYKSTALLLVNDVCGAYCRFCFRKRLFMNDNDEVVRDVTAGLEYIRAHKEITNVLLTGGDPLILSTGKLASIISRIREIDHVQIIRIGTKIPAFNPFRIINDPALQDLLNTYSTYDKKIYIMAHFNHPRELTEHAIEALNILLQSGVTIVNQTPLVRGVNDDANVLAELFNKLSFIGVPPYYLFICRPTLGNKTFAVPVEEAFDIFELARMQCSGLGKRARLVMSHNTGKIEVVGKTETNIFMRYHQAANPQKRARFMMFKRKSDAYWFDDYDEALEEYSIKNSIESEIMYNIE